jgi:hypothetical protein
MTITKGLKNAHQDHTIITLRVEKCMFSFTAAGWCSNIDNGDIRIPYNSFWSITFINFLPKGKAFNFLSYTNTWSWKLWRISCYDHHSTNTRLSYFNDTWARDWKKYGNLWDKTYVVPVKKIHDAADFSVTCMVFSCEKWRSVT